MFRFIVLFALISACYSASIGVDSTSEKREVVPVLRFETDKKPDGSFSFSYEGGDKSFREETGVIENAGTDDEALEVSGSYRYIDADGQEVEVHYTAGKNGFVPVGTNILSEISALARAAADLPNNVEDENVYRKARSKELRTEKTEDEKKNVPEKKTVQAKKPVKESVPEEKVEKETVPEKKSVPVQKVEKAQAPQKKVEKTQEPEKKAKTENVPEKKTEKLQEPAKKEEKEHNVPVKIVEKENVPEKRTVKVPEPAKKEEKEHNVPEKKVEKENVPVKKEEKTETKH